MIIQRKTYTLKTTSHGPSVLRFPLQLNKNEKNKNKNKYCVRCPKTRYWLHAHGPSLQAFHIQDASIAVTVEGFVCGYKIYDTWAVGAFCCFVAKKALRAYIYSCRVRINASLTLSVPGKEMSVCDYRTVPRICNLGSEFFVCVFSLFFLFVVVAAVVVVVVVVDFRLSVCLKQE